MTTLLKQNQTAQALMFLMVDSTDHVTGKTGLSPTVTLSKNGGSFASPSGAVTEVANGWYKVAGNATDANTLGSLVLHATGTGADPTDKEFSVVAFDPQVATNLGLSALPTANPGAAGGLFIAGTNAPVTITGSGDALTLTSSGGNGIGLKISGNGTGAGIQANGGATGIGLDINGGATSGVGLSVNSEGSDAVSFTVGSGSGVGFKVSGNGTGTGFQVNGGSVGVGMEIIGGSTSGDGLVIDSTSGMAARLTSDDSNALYLSGNNNGLVALGTTGSGIVASGTGGHGIYALSSDSASAGFMVENSSTGRAMTVSAASGDALNILTAAGNGDAVSLTPHGTGLGINSADVTKLTNGIILGTAATGTLSTTVITSSLTGYANDSLIGRGIYFLSGACVGEAREITDYASTGGTLTFAALSTAPSNGDAFKIV